MRVAGIMFEEALYRQTAVHPRESIDRVGAAYQSEPADESESWKGYRFDDDILQYSQSVYVQKICNQ